MQEKFLKLAKKNFEKTIDRSIKVWYNIITEREREVHKMTQFEKDVEMFTEHLKMGMISYFMVKLEEGGDTLSIETDDEKFYYDKETGREL